MRILKLGVPFLVAGAVALGIPTQSMAVPISINGLLTNPSFEGGSQANGCPVAWTCDATLLFKVAVPTAAQYPAPNGLVSPAVTPSGTSAAFTPITTTSVGTMYQNIAGQTYALGNSYALDFWLGNPLGGLFPSRVDIQLLAGAPASSQTNTLCDTAGRFATLVSGAQSANDNGTQCLFSFGPGVWQPTDGDWRMYTLTFTTNANIVGDIGVKFTAFADQSGANGALMHLDVVGPQVTTTQFNVPVPEPASLLLLGTGLLGLSAWRLRAWQLRARKS